MIDFERLTDFKHKGDQIDAMEQRYRGSYLSLTIEGKKFIGKYLGFSLDTDSLKFDSWSHGELSVKFNTKQDVYLDIPIPETGLYNTALGMVYFCRKAAKQYKRALNASNTNLLCVPSGKAIELNLSHMEKMATPDDSKFHKLEVGAYNRDWGCANYNGDFWLFNHTTAVGKIDFGKKIIQTIPSPMVQEIYDFLNSGGHNEWQVELKN